MNTNLSYTLLSGRCYLLILCYCQLRFMFSFKLTRLMSIQSNILENRLTTVFQKKTPNHPTKKTHLSCGVSLFWLLSNSSILYYLKYFSCTVVFYVSTYSLKYTLCHLSYLFSSVAQSRILFAIIIEIWTKPLL